MDSTVRRLSSPRAGLACRLWQGRDEIEQATLSRIYAISDPGDVGDPSYVAGLRSAVSAGLTYCLSAIEASGPREPVADAIPLELLAQARYAARAGVSIDTVLRRYFAGYMVLVDFIATDAKQHPVLGADAQWLLRRATTLFDNLVTTVSQEYAREASSRLRDTEARRAAKIRMLLDGQLIDATDLDYELDAWHLGAVATGPGSVSALRDIASLLDRRLLLVRPEDGVLWAWFGGASRLSASEPMRLAQRVLSSTVSLALGEPGSGIEGWRLTHRQAKAANEVARRGPKRKARYAEVSLLAAALHDELLASSLREIYLGPLERERGLSSLIETLSAYFASGRNVSSAASTLGVSRKTVSTRLRSVEEKVGCRLQTCTAEMETALRLRDLEGRQSGVDIR